MRLPTLYKKTKTGATQVCDIYTEGASVFVGFGQLDGKMQTKETVCKPKNVGKKNETTAEEQAISEALSKHTKKIKSGYVLDSSGGLVVKLPQKVKAYIGNEHKIEFPAYSTPKLNGINGTYWLVDGELKLTSRGGDEYPAIPHLENEVKLAMSLLETDCLNGELYIHSQHLQDITSAVKKPKELSKELEFHIFELPNYGGTYKERQKHMRAKANFGPSQVCVVTSILVRNRLEIERHYNRCMSAGLEGTVIYNADAPYEFNTRSSHVYKYKKTQDAEFQVTGFKLDKNQHAVYTCTTEEGESFSVKRKGSAAERLADAAVANSNIGKWLTVEYEVLSKPRTGRTEGVPLKPVGLSFRECTQEGVPLM